MDPGQEDPHAAHDAASARDEGGPAFTGDEQLGPSEHHHLPGGVDPAAFDPGALGVPPLGEEPLWADPVAHHGDPLLDADGSTHVPDPLDGTQGAGDHGWEVTADAYDFDAYEAGHAEPLAEPSAPHFGSGIAISGGSAVETKDEDELIVGADGTGYSSPSEHVAGTNGYEPLD